MTITGERSRLADYVALTKPELTFLSVVTAAAGFFFASNGAIHLGRLASVVVGTVLIGCGVGAINQLIEREFDAKMRRTAHRPIASGRLSPREALTFGLGFSLLGLLHLVLFTNPLAGLLALLTIVLYLFAYTPLKRVTPWATLVGGVVGALPPVIGCVAVEGQATPEAGFVFFILFCWQMPHFMSLAWMYRKDYARAGFKMLTVVEPSGSAASAHMLSFSILLLIATLLPTIFGYSGKVYFGLALLFGIVFTVIAIRFRRLRSNEAARDLFFASLVYLPVLLLALVIDRI